MKTVKKKEEEKKRKWTAGLFLMVKTKIKLKKNLITHHESCDEIGYTLSSNKEKTQ